MADESDSLEGIDLTQFGIPGPKSLEGEDSANYRQPADPEDDAGWFTADGRVGGDKDAPQQGIKGEELAAMVMRLNDAETQIKRIIEQLPRRIPSDEDTRVFPVTLTQTSGANGTKTTAATWAYRATIGSKTIGSSLTPAWPRPNGSMVAATKGLCSKTVAGTVVLEIAYEKPGTTDACPP